ncbi:MAG: hypothetical protein IJN77_04315 [Oscillospiraceae bacterium]|nr:hypothetical protein [Oscillospiraceae bacterium]MBQ6850242.1 hypothetical protein [Oscillospiraceae bacterium]
MDNRMMKAVKNMAIGAAVGAVATMAGAVYVSDNRQAQQAVKSVRRTGKKVARAGRNMMDDMMDKMEDMKR